MVSFRNSQFQAMIFGLVIADAVSHGQLPWGASGPVAAGPPAPCWPAVAIADDRWSHAIATQCTVLSEASPSWLSQSWLLSSDSAETTIAVPASVTDLLVTCPRLLAQLDQHLAPAVAGAGAAEVEAPIVTAFRDALKACLRQDAITLRDLQQQLQLVSPEPLPPSQIALYQAVTVVLAAQGDFQLAIGQSLRLSAPTLGVPVLAGILSAGWVGLSGLPNRYRHELYQPASDVQVWLQHRWQITTGTTLDIWAAGLWRQWSGCYLGLVGRSPVVAVLPQSVD